MDGGVCLAVKPETLLVYNGSQLNWLEDRSKLVDGASRNYLTKIVARHFTIHRGECSR